MLDGTSVKEELARLSAVLAFPEETVRDPIQPRRTDETSTHAIMREPCAWQGSIILCFFIVTDGLL